MDILVDVTGHLSTYDQSSIPVYFKLNSPVGCIVDYKSPVNHMTCVLSSYI